MEHLYMMMRLQLHHTADTLRCKMNWTIIYVTAINVCDGHACYISS